MFTTEWDASWFFNPESTPQSQSLEIEAEVSIASVEGDFLGRGNRIAESIFDSGCDVALFHASLMEQITARVASLRPARVQINVNHGTEMAADLFDGAIHLFRNGVDRTRFPQRPTEWIPLVSDVESRLESCGTSPARRGDFGAAETISATFGRLDEVDSEEYLDALIEIMRRFPSHLHLFAGSGDARFLRGYLHSRHVLSRIRFLGYQTDVASLLPLIDLYIASFPDSGGLFVLEAMGAGKPVVVRGYRSKSHYNSGAELVGLEALIASTKSDFVESASHVIRDEDYRDALAQAIRSRFVQEFSPDRLGSRYVEFLGGFEGFRG